MRLASMPREVLTPHIDSSTPEIAGAVRVEAAEDRVPLKLRYVHLDEGERLSDVVMQILGDLAPLSRLREGQLGGETPKRGVRFPQLSRSRRHGPFELRMRREEGLVRDQVLKIGPQHLGEGFDEVPFLLEKRPLVRRRSRLEVADPNLARLSPLHDKRGDLRPLALSKTGSLRLEPVESNTRGGGFGMLPGRRQERYDLLDDVAGRFRLILEDPGGSVERRELFDPFSELMEDIISHRERE